MKGILKVSTEAEPRPKSRFSPALVKEQLLLKASLGFPLRHPGGNGPSWVGLFEGAAVPGLC